MRRACLLLAIVAMACLAQDQGFVNKRLLKADFLNAKAPVPLMKLPPSTPCMRIPPAERMPTRDVDRSMVIRREGPSPDPSMVIPTPPACK